MNTNTQLRAGFKSPPFWVRCVLIFWILLGTIPIFSLMFGFQYLASPDWVYQVRIPASVSGVILAAFFTWGVVIQVSSSNWKQKLKRFFVILFTPVFGFMIGTTAVTVGGPMFGAVIAGVKIEAPYTVTRFKASGDRSCRDPITLDGLPLLFEKLCGYPEEFGHSLEIGEQILITGRGTEKGIFAKSARRSTE